ncbi:MAG: hypothetical protein KF888_09610 [Nitrosomonas sp.]|nr:hypothetical protein [Nitrosomonas sp.]
MKKSTQQKISVDISAYGCILLLLLTAVLHTQANATTTDVKVIIATFELDEDQITALDQGEIVFFEIAEATQKELALGLAMYLPSPPEKLTEFFRRGDLAMIDPDVQQYGTIAPESDSSAFSDFVFSSDQMNEVNDLLNAEAGDRFNLSAEEMKSLAALKKNLTATDAASIIAAVSQHYRQILLQRWQAYRQHGLSGIAPYARQGAVVDPGEELRIAAANSKLLAHFSPALHTAWLNYPAPLPVGAEELFFWLNNTVDDRPTAILSHRIMMASDTASIIATRQFYVGHSYNSSHLIVGCLPYRDGSVVFYTHRTSTDQVAGVGNTLKRSIGREHKKERMIQNLEGLRTAVNAL